MNKLPLLNIIMLTPVSVFLLLLILQTVFPRRDIAKSGSQRFIHNVFLFAVNTLIMRFMIPITLVMCAELAAKHSFGLFNKLELAPWFTVLTSFIIMDFAIYWQHVATHRVGFLWRLHKIHHSDNDMDVSTAIRFHPIELILSLLYKALWVVTLGVPVVAVVLFELFLFASPAFNHSNLKLPLWLDKKLRWVVATPDVHRIHHSVIISEQNTNYGFFIIWWDKLFGTFTAQPNEGHDLMVIGIDNDDSDFDRVDKMLLGPFR